MNDATKLIISEKCLTVNITRVNLLKYSKVECFNHSNHSKISELLEEMSSQVSNDLYGNTNFSGLKVSVAKNKLNILTLFKPGDILNHILAQE